MTLTIDTVRLLVLSIGTLWLGAVLTRRFPLLSRYNIPIAVTGGIVVATLINLARWFGSVELVWELAARDTLLLVFFSSVGLSAKLSNLREGGGLFVRLALLTVLFLLLQNAVGALGALLVGRQAAYGLIGGSVALAGGHGTAITWGQVAANQGYPDVLVHGLAFATFGLVVGGIVGGPLASRLIARHHLKPSVSSPTAATPLEGDSGPPKGPREVAVSTAALLRTLLVFSLCVLIGAEVNHWLGDRGVVLPGFVTAMAAGVLLTNLDGVFRYQLHYPSIELLGDVSLNLFLCMSLISLSLDSLAGAMLPIAVMLTLQILFALLFAGFVIFRLCGRDYEAAVLSSGFVGIGLGATPVGMANMNAVSQTHGPAPRALLTLPLIGAGVLDLANALVIELYLRLLL